MIIFRGTWTEKLDLLKQWIGRLQSGEHLIKSMILEVAILDIKPNMAAEFETAFKTASPIISSMPGYVSHELQRCI